MLIHYLRNAGIAQLFGLLFLVVVSLTWPGVETVAQAAETVTLPSQTVAPGKAGLTVNLELPAGFKLNKESPSTVSLKSGNKKVVAVSPQCAKKVPLTKVPLTLTMPVKEGQTELQATLRLNYCDEKSGLCFLREVILTLPVEVNKTAANKKLEIVYTVPAN
jgi:hypothetical protein